MLQGLQPPDHRFNSRTHLFILVQKRCALSGQRFVSLTQRAVLFLQVFDSGDQLFDSLCESHQLQIELRFCCIAHVPGL